MNNGRIQSDITTHVFSSSVHSSAAESMSVFRKFRSFFRKALLLLRFPGKWHHFVHYSATKLLVGHGVARIPERGRIRTNTFSEYLAVYGLLSNRGAPNTVRKTLAADR